MINRFKQCNLASDHCVQWKHIQIRCRNLQRAKLKKIEEEQKTVLAPSRVLPESERDEGLNIGLEAISRWENNGCFHKIQNGNIGRKFRTYYSRLLKFHFMKHPHFNSMSNEMKWFNNLILNMGWVENGLNWIRGKNWSGSFLFWVGGGIFKWRELRGNRENLFAAAIHFKYEAENCVPVGKCGKYWMKDKMHVVAV